MTASPNTERVLAEELVPGDVIVSPMGVSGTVIGTEFDQDTAGRDLVRARLESARGGEFVTRYRSDARVEVRA